MNVELLGVVWCSTRSDQNVATAVNWSLAPSNRAALRKRSIIRLFKLVLRISICRQQLATYLIFLDSFMKWNKFCLNKANLLKKAILFYLQFHPFK